MHRSCAVHTVSMTTISRHDCVCGLSSCLVHVCPALHAASWAATPEKEFLAPYQGSSAACIKEMLRLAEFKKGDKILDVGAGDGRVLLHALSMGASRADGWELNENVYQLGLAHLNASLTSEDLEKVNFKHGNGLEAPFEEYDIVFLYLLPEGLKKVENLIKPHIGKKNFRVLSLGWRFESMVPIKEKLSEEGNRMYLF